MNRPKFKKNNFKSINLLENSNIVYGKKIVQKIIDEKIAIKKVFTYFDSPFAKMPELNGKIVYKNKSALTNMMNVNHQGVIAELKSEFQYYDMKKTLENTRPNDGITFLVLDQIQDPQNFGSIIRNAVAFKVNYIIICDKNQSQVNGTVYKTSAGYVTNIKIIRVKNIHDAILKLKKHDVVTVGMCKGKAEQKFEYTDPRQNTAFIVGNEAVGVKPILQKNCDYYSWIQTNPVVESLNVSSATAVILSKNFEMKNDR